jgi:hypothetical protein
MKPLNVDTKYHPEGHWAGRSLSNYIDMHPKAKGARTLTQARILAFGPKTKRVGSCSCGNTACKRYSGGGKASSNC